MKKAMYLVMVLGIVVMMSGCANTFSALGGLMKGVGEDMQTMADPYLQNQQQNSQGFTRPVYDAPVSPYARR